MTNNVVLAGNLKFLTLADLLQLFGSNGNTGILRISSKYAQAPGYLEISDGNPVKASSGALSGADAIFSFFGWMEGEFEFTEENVQKENLIKKSRMELILEGLRMLDDGQVEKLGPESIAKNTKDTTGKKDGAPLIKGPLIDYMYVVDEEEYEAGKEIVIEGKHGSWVWVILEGEVGIIKETPKGPLEIINVGEGAFLGSIASFLMGGNVRSATTVAKDTVQLGVLDSQILSGEFASMSPDFKGLLLSLDKRLKYVTDHVVKLYLKEDDTKDFIKGKKPLIKQGEKDERIFTITQGEALVVKRLDTEFVTLAKLSIEDCFGQIPFLDLGQEPYSASIFASEDLETRPLDPDSLRKEHDQLSLTFKNIVQNLTTSIAVTTMAACELKKKIIKK